MFRMPTAVRITGRTSTITNSFVNGVIPLFPPNPDEIKEALAVLGMTESSVRCSYCGDPHTEWDHLRPLVRKKRPTGYVSEIANLVPACGKCNQSKGGADWRTWMTGSARMSPATRGIPDLSSRLARLEDYERWKQPRQINFENAVGAALWELHWANHERLLELMRECEVTAKEIRELSRKWSPNVQSCRLPAK